MSLIQRSAYINMCTDCGLHADIVFADGSKSRRFASKEVGLLFVDLALKNGKVTPEEGQILVEQVHASPLTFHRSLIDDLYDNEDGLDVPVEEFGAAVRRKPSRGFGMVNSSERHVM